MLGGQCKGHVLPAEADCTCSLLSFTRLSGTVPRAALGGTAAVQSFCSAEGYVVYGSGFKWQPCNEYWSLWWFTWALVLAFLGATAWCFAAKQIHTYRVRRAGLLRPPVQANAGSAACQGWRCMAQAGCACTRAATRPATGPDARPRRAPRRRPGAQASLWSLAAVTCAVSCYLLFQLYAPLDYVTVRWAVSLGWR